MGSNLNFKNFGNDPPPTDGSGTAPCSFPLTRQPSIYSLTFDEYQSTVGGIGKDFESMNMDELLKTLWSAEENQNMGSTYGGAFNLARQGSLTLPRTMSQMTVDEVWRDLKEYDGGVGGPETSGVTGGGFGTQPTLGEVTLEEFLLRAGVVKDERPNNLGFFDDFSRPENNWGLGLGYQQGNGNASNPVTLQQQQQAVQLQHQQQLLVNPPALAYGSPMGVSSSGQLNSQGFRGGNVISNLTTNNDTIVRSSTLQGGGVGILGSAAVSSNNGFLKGSNGETSLVQPVPYAFNGGLRGRKVAGMEKVVERRHKRMLKNRESAARSRARKQVYTTELEDEVAKLKEENQEMRKKQADMMKMHKNQFLEMMKQQNGTKKRRLARTHTGPW